MSNVNTGGERPLRADRERVCHRLLEAVGIGSVNRRLGGQGEAALGAWLAEELSGLGLRVFGQRVQGGQRNVVASTPARRGRPTLLLNAHLDTVDGGPRVRRLREGRVAGRGSCDTKGALVAMVEALDLLRGADAGCRIVLAGTADDEVGGSGARAFLREFGCGIDAAVVGAPTSLDAVVAHKGVLQFWICTRGRMAHAAGGDTAANPIVVMADVIRMVELALKPRLRRPVPGLLGPSSLTFTRVEGGSALNAVPPSCRVAVDCRLSPGDTPRTVLEAVDRALDVLANGEVEIVRDPPVRNLPPLDTALESPIVRSLQRAQASVLGRSREPAGASFATAASLFSAFGVPAAVFGPGSSGRAHSDEEWVAVEEVAQAAEILARAALGWAADSSAREAARARAGARTGAGASTALERGLGDFFDVA